MLWNSMFGINTIKKKNIFKFRKKTFSSSVNMLELKCSKMIFPNKVLQKCKTSCESNHNTNFNETHGFLLHISIQTITSNSSTIWTHPKTGYPNPGIGYPTRSGQDTPILDGYPPSWDGIPPKIGQQKDYLLRGGRYASCFHAGGLFCIEIILEGIFIAEFNIHQLKKWFCSAWYLVGYKY